MSERIVVDESTGERFRAELVRPMSAIEAASRWMAGESEPSKYLLVPISPEPDAKCESCGGEGYDFRGIGDGMRYGRCPSCKGSGKHP